MTNTQHIYKNQIQQTTRNKDTQRDNKQTNPTGRKRVRRREEGDRITISKQTRTTKGHKTTTTQKQRSQSSKHADRKQNTSKTTTTVKTKQE